MIKIDTRSNETLIFNIGISGIRQPDQVLYRLIMSIQDDLSISFKGVYTDGELVFNIPALKDFMPVMDKQDIPFHIEMVVDDYFQIIYESEMELITLPEVTVDKLTHVKTEPIKEDKQKPIKIEKRIEIKEPSKFAKSFEVFITQGEKKE